MGMTDWPAPVWPAWRLQESRQAVAADANGSLQGALGWIRIMSDAGDLDGARQKLAMLQASLDGHRLAPGELRQVIPVALLVHDADTAIQLLAAVFATPRMTIRFAVARSPNEAVVALRVERGVATFIFSDNLFSNDRGEILLQRLVDVYPILGNYVESPLCADGTVAISLGDAGHVPGLAFCNSRPGYFLIPDSIFMDTRGYNNLRTHFAGHRLPWAQRLPVAFWRGTTTGQVTDPSIGWRSLPRVRLCEIAADNLELIDAGITKITQISDPAAATWIADAGLLRPHVPPELFQQYKYQIDIDGNTTSWPGLFMKLLTGSVVLKVPPRDDLQQWSCDRLRPWIHFVPLASDMSDLPEKVRWLRENDVAAQKIGEAGRCLAEGLTYEREIARAAPTVAAAMKDAAGEPVLDLDFGIGGMGVATLREGWLVPEPDGVESAGFQSRIELPRPSGIGGFVVALDLTPANAASQRVSVVLDGEVLAQRRIKARSVIHIPLGRRALGKKAVIALTLLLPDAVPAASAALPAATGLSGIRLHRILVSGNGRAGLRDPVELAEAFTALRALDNPGRLHDLNGPVALLPPQATLRPLYTHHDTLAYADVDAGRLRHGPADAVPHNLFMASVGGSVMLVRVTDAGEARTVRMRPEGRLAEEADQAALDAFGHADRFEPVAMEDAPEAALGLSAAGIVVCAEQGGELMLGRRNVGPWETFRSSPRDQQNNTQGSRAG